MAIAIRRTDPRPRNARRSVRRLRRQLTRDAAFRSVRGERRDGIDSEPPWSGGFATGGSGDPRDGCSQRPACQRDPRGCSRPRLRHHERAHERATLLSALPVTARARGPPRRARRRRRCGTALRARCIASGRVPLTGFENACDSRSSARRANQDASLEATLDRDRS